MAAILLNEMFLGETAEVVSLEGESPGVKRLRDMGVREGRLVDLLHYDRIGSGKTVLGIDGMRIAFDTVLAPGILVRPLKASFETLRHMAHYDNLTACLNRHAAGCLLKSEVDRFAERDLPLALLMADLDHFKRVNDTFGHEAGDGVLKKFVDIARQVLRRSDLICRWGGEEFLILLRGTFLDEAVGIAERFRERIASSVFPPFAESGLVTVSIGGASFPPGRDFERLIADADAALYRAKREGRNRVAI